MRRRLSLAPAALPLLSLLAAAAACSSSISKRPARPQAPPPSPSPPPPSPSPSPAARAPPPPRDNVTFPTYRCPHPYSEFYCLNDAKCFTVLIEDAPLYNCECRDGFVGQRCEYKDLDGSYLLSKGGVMLEKASIATGAVVAVLMFCALGLGLRAVVWSRAVGKSRPRPSPPPPPSPSAA